jgi:hypothetical protein
MYAVCSGSWDKNVCAVSFKLPRTWYQLSTIKKGPLSLCQHAPTCLLFPHITAPLRVSHYVLPRSLHKSLDMRVVCFLYLLSLKRFINQEA